VEEWVKSKVEVKFSLYKPLMLIGMEIWLNSSLNTVPDALEWSASRPERFNPREVCKGKSIPLQTWRGPEGSRRLRVPDFKTIVA